MVLDAPEPVAPVAPNPPLAVAVVAVGVVVFVERVSHGLLFFEVVEDGAEDGVQVIGSQCDLAPGQVVVQASQSVAGGFEVLSHDRVLSSVAQ